ncbi:sulfatase-like hydrolase/transferase [Clostridium cagae]|uniref:sulfatase-like hydrolase/transferase n=1 Tax=Clostridium cagae TaxID=2080751 RepID=UPI003F769964
MNYYNERLEKIIEEYMKKFNINIENINIEPLISEFIVKNCKGKRMAIWGAGIHTAKLFEKFSTELKDTICIIDNNERLMDSTFMGHNVVSAKDISKYKLECIIVSSYGSRMKIREEIECIAPYAKYIDIYENFERNNVNISGSFYDNDGQYYEINKILDLYRNATTVIEKQDLLMELIFKYLNIKDFIYTNKFITEYVFNKYKDFEIFEKLKNELEELISEMKRKVKNRKSDISLFYMDALRAKDVFGCLNKESNMEYLNEKLKESMVFKNAYATSIFTYESFISMLGGKMPFENKYYNKQEIKTCESDFLNKVSSYNYKFNVFSAYYDSFIKDEQAYYETKKIYISQVLWDYFCYLAEKNEDKTKFFSLLYFNWGIHPPHICGYHKKMPVHHIGFHVAAHSQKANQSEEEFVTQYEECMIYVDKQLEFFMELLPSEEIKVIFSDHGQIIENATKEIKDFGSLVGWHDVRYHVPLIINSSKLPSMQYDGLFSMIDFGELILNLMNNRINIKNRNIVEMQLEPIYNKHMVNTYVNAGYEDYVHGFKVFRTNEYKYVVTGNGKEKFYKLSDERINLIEDEKYINKINTFRDKVDVSFPKFDKI